MICKTIFKTLLIFDTVLLINDEDVLVSEKV